MLNRIMLRITLVCALAVSAVVIPACQTSKKAHPEMLGGDTEMTHERHDTGVDSHIVD